MSSMQLINFDHSDVPSIGELMSRIGFNVGLGVFLADHLTMVLQEQHQHVVLTAIAFVRSHGCTAGGNSTGEEQVVEIDSICIPFDLTVNVASGVDNYCLGLHVKINAVRSDGKFQVSTDVLVQRQSRL